jgi:hypothetical protein
MNGGQLLGVDRVKGAQEIELLMVVRRGVA